MTFCSILFATSEVCTQTETVQVPAFFRDLNLDQVVDAITKTKEEYDLKPFFYTSLRDVNAIEYRHEIFRDLENENLFEGIKSFALNMSLARRYLALISNLYFANHKKGWFLEAAEVYCQAINDLANYLNTAGPKSRGLIAFREYVTNYARSDAFTTLLTETQKRKADLSTVKYCVIIGNGTVKVRKYEMETDYSLEVEETFEKFKQGAVKDYRVQLYEGSGMNHVEAQILDCVAKLYPDIFSDLDRFCAHHNNFLDETICAFDREVQFYVSYLEYIARIKRAGLKFCYPQVSNQDKQVYDYEGFDLALAIKRVSEDSSVVWNDFYLQGKERIFVVSGPNQGGKTTFARTFGQLHYLAGIGCLVPGREARLLLFDNLFTHFEKEEDITNLRGKLEDDLFRIHEILNQATSNSIVIMNEILTSTTLQDAIFLGREILNRITELDALCVFVTFLDELASLSEKTVSMVSTVVPENPAVRTFKIVRKPADGLAYALSIAEKYHVTYDDLRERLKA